MKDNTKTENDFIIENQKLVYFVLKTYFGKTKNDYDFEDLAQIGTIALLRAYRTFDKSKNIQFSTYATRVISNDISKYNVYNKRHTISTEELNCDFTENFGDFNNFNNDFDSFNSNIDDNIAFKIDILSRLKKLSKREKKIVILSLKGYSRKELAQIENVSRQYISQIFKRIKQKIL